MKYSFALEQGHENYSELEPLYKMHYGEMKGRLLRDGVAIADYAPRLTEYFRAFDGGWLLNFVIRDPNDNAVGYSNIYVTNDMHNGELIAQEDTIYVLPDHRNGCGKMLAKFVLEHIGGLGVKRMTITPITDLRSGKIWKRMGFKEVSVQMIYTFEA